MSNDNRAISKVGIVNGDDDPSSELVPRLDCAVYIMEISLELARLADDASLSDAIGSSLRIVARAAQNEVKEIEANGRVSRQWVC